MDWRRLALVVALAFGGWWAWGRWGPESEAPATGQEAAAEPAPAPEPDPVSDPQPADPELAGWETFVEVDWDGPVEGLLDDLGGKTSFPIEWDRFDPEIQVEFRKEMTLTGRMTAGNVLMVVSQATGLGLRVGTDEGGVVHWARFSLEPGVEVVPVG